MKRQIRRRLDRAGAVYVGCDGGRRIGSSAGVGSGSAMAWAGQRRMAESLPVFPLYRLRQRFLFPPFASALAPFPLCWRQMPSLLLPLLLFQPGRLARSPASPWLSRAMRQVAERF